VEPVPYGGDETHTFWPGSLKECTPAITMNRKETGYEHGGLDSAD